MELSYKALLELLNTKADKNHTHQFVGTIDNARSLNNVTFDHFIRSDLKDQIIKTNQTSGSLTVESNNSLIKAIAGNNKNYLVIENANLDVNNLTITGYNQEKVIVNINGELLINGQPITGLSTSSLLTSAPRAVVPTPPTTTTSTSSSAPVGSIIQILSHSIPEGYVEANGDELQRGKYQALFDFAYTQTDIISEVDWNDKYDDNPLVEYYSLGDNLTTFRLPNLNSTDSKIRYLIKC